MQFDQVSGFGTWERDPGNSANIRWGTYRAILHFQLQPRHGLLMNVHHLQHQHELPGGLGRRRGRLIFVDSNVPMYMVGNDPSRKIDVQRILERLASERRALVTSSEVFQELLHRYVAAGRREATQPVFDALRGVVDEVFAVEEADVLLAKDVALSHLRLSARDAVHVAVMQRRKITEVLTFDAGFDEVAGITRLPA